MKQFYLLLVSIFCVLGLQAQPPADAVLSEKLQKALDSVCASQKLVGVSANMILSDGSVWNGLSGYSNPHTKAPLTDTTRFQAASISKMYAAGLIFILADEGKLNLGDRISKYLPVYNNIDTNITIRELLKHRSGVAEFLSQQVTSQWYTNPDKVWDPEFIVKNYVGPKTFNHGASFSYSNTNFILLGLIIEKITGNKVLEELTSRFFGPLALNITRFPVDGSDPGNVTPCWSDFDQNGVLEDASFLHTTSFYSMVYTAGAIVSQPHEISRYTRALQGGDLVSPGMLSEMKQFTNVNMGPNCTGYGAATMRYRFYNRDYYGHGGDISGFTTMSVHQPETNVTLTLMTNRDRDNRAAIAAALLKTFNEFTTSINPVSNAFRVSLHPNPVNDALHIDINQKLSGPVKLFVYDNLGKLMFEDSMNADGEVRHKISTDSLQGGNYHLEINTGTDRIFRSFIVVK